MAISWNEIKTRTYSFINSWSDRVSTAREEADAQTFENEFLNIFGVTRSQVAIFEHKVKLPDGNGYIDLFWKGHIMIEMKSPGKDLEKAYTQAKNYANALSPKDLPKGILICDFNRFHYYDLLKDGQKSEFLLSELKDNIELFSDLAGYNDIEYKKQDAVNIEAAEKMGKLHDRLKETGYEGLQLEIYLVRLLFCLFADDTDIFDRDIFVKYIQQRTNEDGSDLAFHLQAIFEVLNKPEDKRSKIIDEQLNRFPYINGGLFEKHLETASFDSSMRTALLDCCTLDWSKISPAIFGAMFQSVMDRNARRNLGAHYTSEENILKLIHPLFLDDLWAEFDKVRLLKKEKERIDRLNIFHDKLANLRFLDPACGCGNFLVITYRELRILEFEVVKELLGSFKVLDIHSHIKINVDQFYGIEIEEFPSQIAQVAMWLMDHQMNKLFQERFGEYFKRIPLTVSASILCKNSLRLDWNELVPNTKLNYILGNPPFLGARMMKEAQKEDLSYIFGELNKSGNLDYVTCWYKKACDYIKGTDIEVAFVSTNSICQGEQVPILWPYLFNTYNITINFAHQTFKWSNEANGNAAVYCIIIGFGLSKKKELYLYHYPDIRGYPVKTQAKNINAYLIDGVDTIVESRTTPLCKVSPMVFGSMPNDNGHLILSESEKEEALQKYPEIEQFIKPLLGADEFLYNYKRYCIWLHDVSPNLYNKHSFIMDRIKKVRDYRLASKRDATKKLANIAYSFGEVRHPNSDYLLVPRTSSESRDYLPIGFIDKNTISTDGNQIIPNATLYEFGILTSIMHMAWMKYVCGRLKSDYRYSASIVYNNFPWPTTNDKQRADIETAAQSIIDIRNKYKDSNLATLYDPLVMPQDLRKAHEKVDRLVEKAYKKVFTSDEERIAFLFEMYNKLTANLFTTSKRSKK